MLRIARPNLPAARAQLSGLVVAAYKGQRAERDDVRAGRRSFSDLVNRLDVRATATTTSQTPMLHRSQVAERADRDAPARRSRIEQVGPRNCVARRTAAAKQQVEDAV